jgi:hypothetical protein
MHFRDAVAGAGARQALMSPADVTSLYLSARSCGDISAIAAMTSSVSSRRARPGAQLARRHLRGQRHRVHERAERDPQLGRPHRAAADRLHAVRALQRHRQHRRPGGQRQPGDAGPAAVEPAVPRARALGVDAERLAALQHPLREGQRGERVARPVARHRDGADEPEEQRRRAALDAGAGEVLLLGEEPHPRGATTGISTLSTNERWLLATITGPVAGKCSRPVTSRRHQARANRRRRSRRSRYHMSH